MSQHLDRGREPQLRSVSCLSPAGLHRMAYWEWGDPGNDKVLVCVHGLTRTGRDFDALARRLADEYRVVCPDIVGRGRSDWLTESAYYVVPQYLSDIVTLLARLEARVLHWFGTSMGGLIGMTLGGLPGASRPAGAPADNESLLSPPVTRMVLNDIGPAMAPSALARIGEYVNDPTDFASFGEAVDYIRTVSAAFGDHTPAQWEELTRHVVREEGGRWVKHYDPGLAAPFFTVTPQAAQAGEAILWRSFDAIRCPTLLVRGERSDLLSANTAREMLSRNRNVALAEFPNVGHAPTFMSDEQIGVAADFLLSLE